MGKYIGSFKVGQYLSYALLLFLMTGAPVRLLAYLEGQLEIYYIVPVTWLLVTSAIFFFWSKEFLFSLTCNKKRVLLLLLFLCVLWPLLSVAWSVNPLESIKMWVVFASSSFAMYLVGRCGDFKDTSLVTLYVLAIVFVGSLFLFLIYPELAMHIHSDKGSPFKGVLTHKNHLGNLAAFGFVIGLVILVFSLNSKAVKVIAFLGLILSLLIMVLADSATSFFVVIAGSLILIMLYFRSYTNIKPTYFFGAFVLCIIVGFLSYEYILQFIGRNSTLTGRVSIWLKVINEIKARPLLGYGFEAYWSTQDIKAVSYGYGVRASHNGMLKIILDQGLVGFTLIIGLCVALLYQISNEFFSKPINGRLEIRFVLAVSLISMVFVNNIAENTLTQAGSVINGLLFYAIGLLDKDCKISNESVLKNSAHQ